MQCVLRKTGRLAGPEDRVLRTVDGKPGASAGGLAQTSYTGPRWRARLAPALQKSEVKAYSF
jgi:hypothetical protein